MNQKKQSLKVGEQWPIDKPIPYARNARKISDQAVSAVAGSIKEFGFNSPIIVDGEGVIIAGHTRLRAAQSLGLKTVPVIVAEHLTKEQAKAYRLADNRVSEFTEWDRELLELELIDLKEFDLEFAKFELLEPPEESPEEPSVAEQSDATFNDKHIVIVDCTDEAHQEKIYNMLKEMGESCKVSSM